MNILFNYNFDPANGLNYIETFTELEYADTGAYEYNDTRLTIPIQLTNGDWKVMVYDYYETTANTSFVQILDVSDDCSETLIRAVGTTEFIAVLNNDTHKCHIYERGALKPWDYSYSIDVEYSASTTTEDAGRVKIAGDFLMLSDWTISPLGTYSGIINIYKFNTFTQQFAEFMTLTLADSVRYGYAIDLRVSGLYTFILAGDPKIDDVGLTECGAVDYVIMLGNSIVGADTIFGDNDGDNLGNSVSCYLYDVDVKCLVAVGAENFGALDSGRVHTYTATITTLAELAFLAYALPSAETLDRHFGNSVKINNEEKIMVLETGTNKAVLLDYGVAWVIDTTFDAYSFIETFGVYSLHRNIFDGHYLVYAYIDNGSTYLIFFLNKVIHVKNVKDGSFYTSSVVNNYIQLTLGFSINGKYRVVMEMDNNIKMIDTHNDVIYFMEAKESGGSYTYTYQSVSITHGDYTEAELATEVAYKMNVLHSPETYYAITYNATTQKYTTYLTASGIGAGLLFSFGSNIATSYLNSAQDTIMGFYNNDQTIFSQSITANRTALLQVPQILGINVVEAIPIRPTRNANPANEVHIIANVDGTKYEILETDEQDIKFTERTNTITMTFKSTYNGTSINVNTNQISGRLLAI